MEKNDYKMLDPNKFNCSECGKQFKISKHETNDYSWTFKEKGKEEKSMFCSYSCYSKAFNRLFKGFTPERQIEIGWKTDKKGLDDIKYRGR